jgi:hypothetical protein
VEVTLEALKETLFIFKMFRRTSNNGVLTSREYNQKIVPLFSEMTRSKTLQAESVVLIEKNQTALVKLGLANNSFDYSCSASIDSSPSSETLPILISQEKSWTRSCENTDEHFLKPATRNMLEHLQFTGSVVVDTSQKSSGGLPNGMSSTTSLHERKLQPISQELIPMVALSDSDDSDSPTPEQTYAEYLRTHTLPLDPPLPQLKNPPSASLLQGTTASLRRQSLASNLARKISVSAPPSSSLLQETTTSQLRHVSIPSSDLSSKQWNGRNSSSTNSPTDAILSRKRISAGIATPSPLTSASSSASASPTKEPQPCILKQNNLVSTGINCSSDTSVESASSFHLFLTRTTDRSSKLSQSTSTRESRKPPVNQGVRRSRKGFAMSSLDRSEFWQKVVVIAHAQRSSEFVVSEYRERIRKVEKKAACCIARLFLRRRATRFAIMNFRREKVYHISRFFAKVVRV